MMSYFITISAKSFFIERITASVITNAHNQLFDQLIRIIFYGDTSASGFQLHYMPNLGALCRKNLNMYIEKRVTDALKHSLALWLP